VRRISFRGVQDRRDRISLLPAPALPADLFQARGIDDEAMTHIRS
jgi:hypothetical protein